MYDDSQALSPDHSRPIFPPNSCRAKQDYSSPMDQSADANSSSNYSPSPNSMVVNVGSRFGCGEGNGHSQLPPQYPRQNGGGFRGVNSVVGSMGLARQSSSPPCLFSQITSQNGYGFGSYRMADGGANGDLSTSSLRLKNDINLTSGSASSLGLLSRFTEVANQNDAAKVGNNAATGDNSFFTSSGFTYATSWNDSSPFADSFNAIKQEPDNNDHRLFALPHQQGLLSETGPTTLSHHLSLPKTSSEMFAVEKLLQLQDTVPCKIRAKRGCATHPRSIAERVRRTRISERMRKLQELVPNMDKQTNTADMLDLAVDYIKSLRKQYKTLSDNCANCKCSAASQSQR